jgi:hypothetical protein
MLKIEIQQRENGKWFWTLENTSGNFEDSSKSLAISVKDYRSKRACIRSTYPLTNSRGHFVVNAELSENEIKKLNLKLTNGKTDHLSVKRLERLIYGLEICGRKPWRANAS